MRLQVSRAYPEPTRINELMTCPPERMDPPPFSPVRGNDRFPAFLEEVRVAHKRKRNLMKLLEGLEGS